MKNSDTIYFNPIKDNIKYAIKFLDICKREINGDVIARLAHRQICYAHMINSEVENYAELDDFGLDNHIFINPDKAF